MLEFQLVYQRWGKTNKKKMVEIQSFQFVLRYLLFCRKYILSTVVCIKHQNNHRLAQLNILLYVTDNHSNVEEV